MQGQHRAVSPCEFKYQNFWYFVPPMLSLFTGLTPLPGICGSLAVLAGPVAGLAVWVFLRVAKTRKSVLDSQIAEAKSRFPQMRIFLLYGGTRKQLPNTRHVGCFKRCHIGIV